MSEELRTDDIELSGPLQAQEEAETKAPKGKKAKAEEKAPEPVAEAPPTPETDEEAPEQPEASEDAEPEKAEEEKGKRRGKAAAVRIDELTKNWREEQRRREELEARLARLEAGAPAKADDAPKQPDPADPKYEFGEADPNYLADLVDYKVEKRLHDEKQERTKADTDAADEAKRKAMAAELNTAWQEKAAKASEKYPDFNETVIESAANNEWELLPLSAAAVAGSDVGADIAYHLATHPEEAKKLADAERDFHASIAAARQAGLPPEVAQLMARPALRYAQEIFERVEAECKGKEGPKGKTVTEAPEPPTERVRGNGGRFAPDFSSENCDLGELAKAIKG
jgi:hypothetical protein